VKYTFDWGDGTTSTTGLVNSGTIASASHTWSTAGTYQVKAIATDSKGESSGWSDSLSVSIWGSGRTIPGATNWKAFTSNAIYLDVDTSAAGFTATPRYFTSLGGSGSHWTVQGVNAIYSATSNGFRVYLYAEGTTLTPAYANSLGWYVQWLGVPSTNANAGSTPIGTTNWKAFTSNAIYLDVDTSAAGFTATPRYFTSLGGNGGHWTAQGVNAIYSATSNGFRVYLYAEGTTLTPAYANNLGWYVQWLGVPSTNANAGSTPIGTTNWKAFTSNAIYLDVDTSAAGFTATPRYFTSLGGYGSHWTAQGINAIYAATSKGFRIYLYAEGTTLTPAYANSLGWYVQWLGVTGTSIDTGSTPAGQSLANPAALTLGASNNSTSSIEEVFTIEPAAETELKTDYSASPKSENGTNSDSANSSTNDTYNWTDIDTGSTPAGQSLANPAALTLGASNNSTSSIEEVFAIEPAAETELKTDFSASPKSENGTNSDSANSSTNDTYNWTDSRTETPMLSGSLNSNPTGDNNNITQISREQRTDTKSLAQGNGNESAKEDRSVASSSKAQRLKDASARQITNRNKIAEEMKKKEENMRPE
jgi:hypothetical protein